MIEVFDISYIVTLIEIVAALIALISCIAWLPSGSTMIEIAFVPWTFASDVIVGASVVPSSPPPPSPVVPCGDPQAATRQRTATTNFTATNLTHNRSVTNYEYCPATLEGCAGLT